MPARVVVVHDDPDFVEAAVTAIRVAGFDAAAFTNPTLALDALETAEMVELLVTCIDFGPGKQHGLSLARMGRYRRPALHVLFIAGLEFSDTAEGLGEFMPPPIAVPDLVDAVRQALSRPSG